MKMDFKRSSHEHVLVNVKQGRCFVREKSTFKLILVATVSFLLMAGAWGKEKGLTFYASFDKGDKANFSKGNPAPLEGSNPGKLVPGIKGEAMRFTGRGNFVKYLSKGNYDNARGSIEMWVRIDRAASGSKLFFEGNGKTKPELRINYVPQGFFFVTHNAAAYCRVFCDGNSHNWHHLVICWDKNIGTYYFLDGKPVNHRGGPKTKNGKGFCDYQRIGKTAKTFMIGGNYGNNDILTVDEFKIYNYVLSGAAVKAKFSKLMRVKIKIEKYLIDWKKPELKLIAKNISNTNIPGKIFWRTFKSDRGKPATDKGAFSVAKVINLKAGENKKFLVKPNYLSKSGRYCIETQILIGNERVFSNLYFAYIATPVKKQISEKVPKVKLKLLKEFDCAKSYGLDEFCDDGKSRVVDSPLGKYRETAKKAYSRFAYRFFVKDVGKPHLLEVVWPDNRKFEMEVAIDSRQGSRFHMVENGVIAGGRYPNTNKLKKYKLIFWPTHKECAVMIIAHVNRGKKGKKNAYSGAVKSIKIYRIQNSLPAVKLSNMPMTAKQRTVGSQDEDCSTFREFSTFFKPGSGPSRHIGFKRWFDGLIRRYDYMNFIGQNLFSQTALYNAGTIFPDSPISRFGIQKSSSPDYFFDLVLYLAAQHGIKVNFGLRFLVLPKLELLANKVSISDIIAGKETIRNISWNGIDETVSSHVGYPENAPTYNILHPTVQNLYLSFFKDLMDRYGQYRSFNGIDLLFWRIHCMFMGSLKYGYSDFTVNLFEKETGIKVPGVVPDKKRFLKRYLFLVRKNKQIREKWITWRCQKVHQFWMKVYNLIQKKKPGTKLTFQTWGVVPRFKVWYNRASIWRRGEENSIYNNYREAGFDLNLFKAIPHLYIGNVFYPNLALGKHSYIDRDYEFSDARIKPFANSGRTAVWLEQARRETFRKAHTWGAPLPNYWFPEGRRAPYKRKGGKSNKRAGGSLWKSPPVMPNSDYYLEYYSKCLADWDVREITDGGIGTTTLGVEDELRDFIRAYRTLPTEYFKVFKNVSDPVCVRYWQDRFYLVNREFYPIKVKLQFNKSNFKLHNLATDDKIEAAENITVTVNPFRLLSYKIPKNVKLASVQVIVPQEKINWLKKRLDKMLIAIRKAEKSDAIIPFVKRDIPWFKKELKKAWKEKRYARLRQMLESYWARNIYEDKLLARFIKSKINNKIINPKKLMVKAVKVKEIPAIDSGKWDNIPSIPEMFDVTTLFGKMVCAKSTLKTEVKCAYTDKAIAFFFDCQSNKEGKWQPGKSDLVEVFLSPNKNSQPYYQFRMGITGDKSEKRCNTKIEKFGKPENYNPKYDFQTKIGKNGWLARVVIPFKELGNSEPPQAKTIWRLNLGRQIRDFQTKRIYFQGLRCDLKYGFHCPEKFANVIF